jgi:ComF family protein
VLPHLLALIAPPLCAICGDSCAADQPICNACSAAIAGAPAQRFAVPGATAALAAAPYDGAPRQLISALKFSHRLALADVAAEAIAAKATPLSGAIVPVPPDPWRLRLRGFDPAAAIAEALARRVDLPLAQCLSRRHAPRQVGKPRAQRLASGHDVRINAEAPRTAILLDDVATTGATLAECARALRGAGSLQILALTFARA